ncbi:MAG TPA: DNA gyrase subunit A [Anaerohalosphaeraceae bacterium]|nr:DNA gyrase subunit A [Anaerohalosphaeraceae bacterium]HQG06951.1 DNA gyrase subunit A [Anaerohalosphaeraceae bacterium]HQI08523.1 DNA gyrase subunit A [Anaerohalosphaeraceae bacterium]HQJ68745.1 DNA gyrase subunit A [Anaerohalosphaeraceae bacterium]
MEETKPTDSQEQFEEKQILDELKTSYLNYAMSVIVSRALPDVRDGLKPSQRRILVAMNDLNLGPRSKHRKCAKIVGDTSGNYHPHGDQATYGTLVRMGQDWNMRVLLVDPQGNFGSIDADPPAAMRYTEARLTQAAIDMLEDLKLETVDFVPNYDETRMEPVVLPSKFPNLLVNGASGIAVGMATNIPPHHVGEVCDALLLMIDDPDCGFKDILEKLPGPDFPTGGIICGRKGILDAYVTGRGHLKVRCRSHIETTSKGRTRIIITEIPYMVVRSNVVAKIAECVHTGTIDEIADLRDESDRKGMRIVIELKKDADSQVVLNKLYRYTPLQTTFAVNNVALVNNRPETLNIKQMLKLFISHRLTVIRRRTRFLLRKCRNRAHILEGLILAVSDIDEIIALIKASADAPTAKQNLMRKPLRLSESETLKKILPAAFVNERSRQDQFLTGPQADAILTMQLQRLTGLEIEKLAKEYAELSEKIADYEALLANRNLQLDVIREDLYELKERYKDKRRTEIITEEADEPELEDLIAEEETLVMISHGGYIKRSPIDAYRKQGRGGKGIIASDTKEGDFIEHLFAASTHDYLLFFTNRGICHWLKVYHIPEMSRQSKGRNLVNLLHLGPDEKIASILNVRSFDDTRQLVMATRKGLVKKTVLSAYGNPRSSGVIAIKLDEDDDLIGAAITSGEDEIILGTRDGMAIRFPESQVRSMGRVSRGVQGIRLRPGDEVVDLVIAEPNSSLLTICENGYGKRTPIEEYRPQNRGGLGLINIKTTERNGKVVALKTVHDDDELMLITANGMMIRTGLEQVREIGRNTAGVRMITLKEGDKLVAAARLASENGQESESESEGSEQASEDE